jgi:subtilisin family serine protease
LAADAVIAAGGVLIAAPGGSRGTTRPWVGQPARCSGFIAVAAVDKNAQVASFSSAGPGNIIALAAPGVRIHSTYNDGQHRELNGTARSACHVAGAAALLKEFHPDWNAAQIRDRLIETARDLEPAGIDPDTGAGLLDCRGAVFA